MRSGRLLLPAFVFLKPFACIIKNIPSVFFVVSKNFGNHGKNAVTTESAEKIHTESTERGSLFTHQTSTMRIQNLKIKTTRPPCSPWFQKTSGGLAKLTLTTVIQPIAITLLPEMHKGSFYTH